MDPQLRFTRFTGKRLHLGVCGSIASYKALDLLRRWRDAGLDVGATLTESARRFVTPLAFEALGASPVFDSLFAHGTAGAAGAADAAGPDREVFPHLMPGAAAHAFAIVAASASTLARLAHGMADEILSCQALAFPGPLVIAPAMNPRMWANPATQANWATLRERGHLLVEPVSGRVACMEEGAGRMADVREIYLAALKAVSPQDMAGRTVMLTLGPTREYWDGVRFWSNPSTGIMGAALAVAAYLRGAAVHAVCGPCSLPGEPWLPRGIVRHDVVSAREMFQAASELWPTMDTGIFTAAVADFAPPALGPEKFKKAAAGKSLELAFSANPDILKTLATARRPDQKVVGFAAETRDLENAVRGKLAAKNADMIVGNYATGQIPGQGSGFASPTNTVFIADARGESGHIPELPKPDLAWRILDWLLRL